MSGIKRFLQDTSANMAMLFAFAAVPMVLAAGVAVDTVQHNYAETVLQAATDAAALGGAGSGKTDQADIDRLAREFLTANNMDKALDDIKVIEAKLDKDKRKFFVHVRGARKTSMMHLAGYDAMNLDAYAEVKLPGYEMEVALVLDNTASMNASGRLPALKTASKDLIKTLLDLNNTDGKVKIGIVPFGEYVNVGLSRRNKSWLDVPNDSSVTTRKCWPEYKPVNCVTKPAIVDGIPTGGTYQDCKWVPTGTQKCGDVTDTKKWHGCVGSRNNPLDEQIGSLSNRYPGLMNITCTKELMELTDSKSNLESKINSMSGSGNTYIPAGLLWGWNLLDSDEPLGVARTKADMAAKDGIKAMVLMTDGENTRSATGATHGGWDRAAADKKTKALCDGIKADGITVYTVAFMVTDPSAKGALLDCASNPDKAFAAEDAAQLSRAFQSIGENLQSMHISK
jgi:Flp pilus assembly protein TadG